MIEMLENIDAIIFDMDGTLLDSMWIWPDIDKDFLEKYHLDMPEGFQEGMEGKREEERRGKERRGEGKLGEGAAAGGDFTGAAFSASFS